jgi:hypothetical protein
MFHGATIVVGGGARAIDEEGVAGGATSASSSGEAREGRGGGPDGAEPPVGGGDGDGSGGADEVAALCVAYVDKIFVQVSVDEWVERGPPGTEPTARFEQSYLYINGDASLIQLSDAGRGLRLFFDARDADAVLGRA